MSWEKMQIGEIFEIQLGKMLDRKKNEGEMRPYLANRNVRWDDFDLTELPQMRFTQADRERYDLQPGDLLVCEGGEVGRTAVWTGESRDIYFQKALHRLRARDSVESRYVMHYMRWAAERNLFARLTSTTSIAHLTKTKLEKVQIPLPSLPQQKRIAAILDAANALRSKRRESLEHLDALVQSVFLEMFGDPVTNPRGWEVGVMEDLLKSTNYGTSKKASTEPKEFPVLRMGNMSYSGEWDLSDLKYVDFDEKERRKYLVHRGQILFNRTNSKELVGKTAVYREQNPMAFAGYLIRGVVGEKADPEFIGTFMNLPQTKQYLRNLGRNIVGMANINATEFKAIPVIVPPLEEQRQFAGVVHEVLEQKERVRAHLAELDTLFASLQSRAFRGEL